MTKTVVETWRFSNGSQVLAKGKVIEEIVLMARKGNGTLMSGGLKFNTISEFLKALEEFNQVAQALEEWR